MDVVGMDGWISFRIPKLKTSIVKSSNQPPINHLFQHAFPNPKTSSNFKKNPKNPPNYKISSNPPKNPHRPPWSNAGICTSHLETCQMTSRFLAVISFTPDTFNVTVTCCGVVLTTVPTWVARRWMMGGRCGWVDEGGWV